MQTIQEFVEKVNKDVILRVTKVNNNKYQIRCENSILIDQGYLTELFSTKIMAFVDSKSHYQILNDIKKSKIRKVFGDKIAITTDYGEVYYTINGVLTLPPFYFFSTEEEEMEVKEYLIDLKKKIEAL